MTKNILFIDDDPTVLMVGEIMLKKLGYNTITAERAKDGMNLITKEIDLVLLDLMLPDFYGLDVLEYIKTHKELSHIPVIIQTGINDQDEINKAYKFGAANVLLKPYNKDELKKILEEHFGKN
jgi:two-component system, sensor histidine kinase ChiS